ncbi:MAG: hypothetical protein JJD93_16460 [Ilumatobacteraceae bacterium]|nr:hypothetical protein [Ilumatobacteraceae bacterium]
MDKRVRNELVEMIDRALGEEPKPALIAARQLKAEVDWLTERAVALARREGYDWVASAGCSVSPVNGRDSVSKRRRRACRHTWLRAIDTWQSSAKENG